MSSPHAIAHVMDWSRSPVPYPVVAPGPALRPACWFPCVDDGAALVHFTSSVTVAADLTAVAPGVLVRTEWVGGGGGGGGSGDGRDGHAKEDKSARAPDRHRRLRRFVFASGGVPVQAHQMVLTVGTFVTQKQFPASTAAAAIAAAAAAAAAAAERDATEMTEEEEEAAAAVSSTHSLFAPPGYGTELKAGAYTRPLLSSPKPFWSHLPVSPCLIDWGKIMHPTYPTKCAYVEPKGGRV